VKAGISVIIPVQNREDLIADALNSVFTQTLQPQEIIVVDDASSDNTCEVVAGFGSKVRLLRNTQAAGPAGARNLGLKSASCEYAGFLDSDDLWSPGALHCLKTSLDETAADIAWGLCETRLLPGGTLPDPKWPTKPSRLVLIPTMLFRAAALRQLHGFDATLRFGEDTDVLMRAGTQGLTVVQIEETVLIHRRHAGNMTLDAEPATQAWFEIARRAIGRRRAGASS
jgi:GT2 family glycosyltransferase